MPLSQRPTGTVTFLFTDIEGSTKLWESHPDAMRASLARHDALMRQAIGASNGYVFKTIGDAFCAAFSTAAEALEAVLAAQLALTAEPWPEETPIRVRMALHTGAVEYRDDDYFGPPVNRVARLLSTAHGGQIVLSQTSFDLVRDSLPSRTSIKDLGSHQLKDLARPEQVFQLLHPDLPANFAASEVAVELSQQPSPAAYDLHWPRDRAGKASIPDSKQSTGYPDRFRRHGQVETEPSGRCEHPRAVSRRRLARGVSSHHRSRTCHIGSC